MVIDVLKKLISWVNQIIIFFLKSKSKKKYKKTKTEESFIEREITIKEIMEKNKERSQSKKEIGEKQDTKTSKNTEEDAINKHRLKIKEKEDTKINKEEITTTVSESEKDGLSPEKDIEDIERSEGTKKELRMQKPRIRKFPTESKKKSEKISKRKSLTPKERIVVDLGEAKRITRRKSSSRTKSSTPKTSHTSGKPNLPSQRILTPYVEINLDEAKVFLVLPKQTFDLNSLNISSEDLEYELEINEKIERIPVKVNINERIIELEEKRIELEKPVRNFVATFPKEINKKKYKYEHKDEAFYIFILSGNSGKLHYLYDKNGNMNPLPKRDVWFLLNEDFELLLEPDLIEERWIWEKYQLIKINLKEWNEVIIRNKTTDEEKVVSCAPTFTFDNQNTIFDDLGEQSPIFAGNNIRIIAPGKNSSGWVIWIQNKSIGSKTTTNNWTGEEPFTLKLTDYLRCKCGEFQIDICDKKIGSVATLFFRYLPLLQLNYTKEFIIPQLSKGHKEEKVEIILENSEEFEIETSQKVITNQKGFTIIVPPENDTIRFSISHKNEPENKVNLQITLPRMRWKFSQKESWKDKSFQIERDDLISAEDFYLFVRINTPIKYDVSVILESNGTKIQESKCVRKGVDYSCLLNQFYDTINKNKDKLTFRLRIEKDNQIISEVPIIFIPAVKTASRELIPTRKICLGKSLVKGRLGFRVGKGFSKDEILEAGVEIKDIKHLNIPYDKRRKSIHSRNVKTLKTLIGGENNGDRSN